jgi:hypothetical protein
MASNTLPRPSSLRNQHRHRSCSGTAPIGRQSSGSALRVRRGRRGVPRHSRDDDRRGYDLCQSFGWKQGMHWKPGGGEDVLRCDRNVYDRSSRHEFPGHKSDEALVYAGIVQGLSTPFLTLIVLLITSNRRIMGEGVNRRAMNPLGGLTTAALFAARACLVYFWIK